MENVKPASLSWLVVSTRDYKKESDWFWNKFHHCCYGLPKKIRTDDLKSDLASHYIITGKDADYYEGCVLMPELQEMDIYGAAEYLREWCNENDIPYEDDLENYKIVEAGYWG